MGLSDCLLYISIKETTAYYLKVNVRNLIKFQWVY